MTRRTILPTQLPGSFTGPLAGLLRLPMLAFEVTLGLWLIKGAALPGTR